MLDGTRSEDSDTKNADRFLMFLASFLVLYNLPGLTVYSLQHLWRSSEIHQSFFQPRTLFEDLLKHKGKNKGLIVTIYNILISNSSNTLPSYTQISDTDCQTHTTELQWNAMWSFCASATKSIHILQLNYKRMTHHPGHITSYQQCSFPILLETV